MRYEKNNNKKKTDLKLPVVLSLFITLAYLFYIMTPVAKYYSKVFGLGLGIGGAMEILLIKSNYCKKKNNIFISACKKKKKLMTNKKIDQMLAASEAKQNLKDLQQEAEDLERYQRMKETSTS